MTDQQTGISTHKNIILKFKAFIKDHWKSFIGLAAPFLAFCAIVFFPKQLSSSIAVIPIYLPLALPIIMVLISIGVRINELNNRQGWLDLCNHFASGYVTFAIWALVSSQSVKQYIWINSEKVLDKSYAVPLVVTAFGMLAVCSLVAVLAKKENNDKTTMSNWQTVQAVFVGLSLLALICPIVLFEDKAKVEERTGKSLELKSYTVSIAYRDPSFNQYIGRTSNPLIQCAIYRNVAAKTPSQAKEAITKIFMESEQSYQNAPNLQKGNDQLRKKVEFEQTWVVAEADDDSTERP